MLSLARSRLTISVHLLFLALNGCGVFFALLYNTNTPDLYPNNAHHRIGWLATSVVTAQVILGILFAFADRGKKVKEDDDLDLYVAVPAERTAFLPVSMEAMAEHHKLYSEHGFAGVRWSGDSGQGSERASSSLHSHDRKELQSFQQPEAEDDADDDQHELSLHEHDNQSTGLHKFLKARIYRISPRTLTAFHMVYDAIDRTILILAFVAFVTGGVTYAGILVRFLPSSAMDVARKLTIHSAETTSSTVSPIS
jgi:hypothetical protein